MDVIGPMATEAAAKYLWDSVATACRYLARYKKNIQNLKKEAEHLRRRSDDVQKWVDEARERLEEPISEVKEWLKEANEVQLDVDKILKQHKENIGCLNGGCSNWATRYSLSKEAVEKADHAKEVYERGGFSRVSQKTTSPSVELMQTDCVDFLSSTKAAVKRVREALSDENIKLIGVYGMGGVGKTTLMKRLNNDLDKTNLFNKVIMVTVSKDVDLKKIQHEIAERLGFKLEHENEVIRANRLRKRLELEGTVLIILDDVWSELNLCELGIPSRSEHKGCKIILTTRMESVCLEMGTDDKIKLQVLSEGDSWSLFRMKAGNVIDSPTLRPIAKKIIKSCGGLPLAIVAIASCLKLQSSDVVWKDALKTLKNPMGTEVEGVLPSVIRSLRFSYDHLDGEGIKLFFLLCCLFPEDDRINVVDIIHYGIGERLIKIDGSFEDATKRGKMFIDKLKASSLFLESEGGDVMLHDVVRDLAIAIASREHGFFVNAGVGLNGWPAADELESCTRISLMCNRITTLTNQPKCPRLLTLLLRNNRYLEKISDHFFEEMKALVVLDLSKTCIQQLPSSISCLNNLRTLCLNHCSKLEDISTIRGLHKLEILSLAHTRIIELPKGLIGGLRNLKHLDLRYNWSLKRVAPKVISSLSSLEELYMEGSFADWEVGRDGDGDGDGSNADFCEVASLTRLMVLHVTVNNGNCLYQDYEGSFQNLNAFRICLGVDDDHFETLASRRLSLKNAVIPVPDWVNVLVSKTEELVVSHCKGLKNLLQLSSWATHKSFCRTIDNSGTEGQANEDPSSVVEDEAQRIPFRRLKALKIVCCEEIEDNLLNSYVLPQMCNLEYLKLGHCGEMVRVFNTERLAQGGNDALIPKLAQLELAFLDSLTSIWKGGNIPVRSLHGLRKLNICFCDNLMHLFSTALAQALANLEVLQVGECPKMEKIFEAEEDVLMTADTPKPPILNNLRVVDVWRCHNLKYVFTSGMAQHLVKLESLAIAECDELEEIICMDNGSNQMTVDKGVIPSLKMVRISNLPKLTSIYEGSAAFDSSSPELVTRKECPNLNRLPLKSQSALLLEKAVNGSSSRNGEINASDQGLVALQSVNSFKEKATSSATTKKGCSYARRLGRSRCDTQFSPDTNKHKGFEMRVLVVHSQTQAEIVFYHMVLVLK